MKRIIIFIYGIVGYLSFVIATLYAIGFLNNIVVPTGVEKGALRPFLVALIIDVGLIALFGLAHSVMARGRFKAWWTRIIPQAAERSTYVLQSSLLLLLIFWFWQPIPTMVWSVDGGYGRFALQAIQGLGWVIAILATFLINHFELTGLQHVFHNLRHTKPGSARFVNPFLYKVVRHPLQLGLLIAFWVTPELSVGHFIFAATMTVYILIGLYFEERDLQKLFGAEYVVYQRTTPKLLPHPFKHGMQRNHAAQVTEIRHEAK